MCFPLGKRKNKLALNKKEWKFILKTKLILFGYFLCWYFPLGSFGWTENYIFAMVKILKIALFGYI
jgi:hypothetical protein